MNPRMAETLRTLKDPRTRKDAVERVKVEIQELQDMLKSVAKKSKK